ncbi:carbonyl reductase [NADPH] 3-like isoform X2 [Acanthaster planci]|uniref:Carbonyl reductase [NADPH] 3-like isoform X2 n=1 Tax=Acanthaster planci TaxID=133434 RepID=A0A8B7XIT9_ACAPL|nr:carbonyl reductase [NADPH] 3-like isoform X2 [Acanthaster planci]
MAHRVALVTGSNKGVGLGIVRALCKKLDSNWTVYLTSMIEEEGKEAVAKLNQEGLKPAYHQLDILEQSSIDKVRAHLEKEHGGLDILINNAGIAFKESATEPIGVQAKATLATNFFGTLANCRALIPLIRSHGRVVNIASRRGKYAFEAMSPEVQGRFRATRTEQDVEELMKEYIEIAQGGDPTSKGWPTSTYGTSKMGLIALTKIQAADVLKDKTRENILIMAKEDMIPSVGTNQWNECSAHF